MIGLYLPTGIFMSGFALFALGLYRVWQRTGLEYEGLSTSILMTEQQRQQQRDKFWLALFDPKHKLDFWLIIGGFLLLGLTIASIAALAR